MSVISVIRPSGLISFTVRTVEGKVKGKPARKEVENITNGEYTAGKVAGEGNKEYILINSGGAVFCFEFVCLFVFRQNYCTKKACPVVIDVVGKVQRA